MVRPLPEHPPYKPRLDTYISPLPPPPPQTPADAGYHTTTKRTAFYLSLYKGVGLSGQQHSCSRGQKRELPARYLAGDFFGQNFCGLMQ